MIPRARSPWLAAGDGLGRRDSGSRCVLGSLALRPAVHLHGSTRRVSAREGPLLPRFRSQFPSGSRLEREGEGSWILRRWLWTQARVWIPALLLPGA